MGGTLKELILKLDNILLPSPSHLRAEAGCFCPDEAVHEAQQLTAKLEDANLILIITNKADAHADAGIRELNKIGYPVLRINTEDIISKYRFEINIKNDGLHGRIEDSLGRVFEFDRARVAWFRKPSHAFTGDIDGLDAERAQFAREETEALLETLYSLPNMRWVNDPFAAERAKVKVQQLKLATELGMHVPRTLVTADPRLAREFVDGLSSDVLVKAIYTSNVTLGGIHHGVLSCKLTKEDFEEYADSIKYCPTLIQEYCEKEFELRVTIVGSRVTAVRIDSQADPRTAVDWRAVPGAPQSPFDLPQTMLEFCKEFICRQNLLYGAMDFIVSSEGEYFFLENNPFGNYLWQDALDTIDITGDMVDLLVKMDQGAT